MIISRLRPSSNPERSCSRVPLKRQGKEYAARCPFHDERSASFTVSPTK
ncbi:hypothetical protein BMR86_23900, partial [Stenotrophomonas sp. KAs 5-3]